jgi:branched-subunit amino acid transport protein
MPKSEFLLLVAGMGLVTYIPRWFPLFFLTRRPLAHWLAEWLDLIPAAIFGALIFSDLFTTGEPRCFDFFQTKSLVAIPTFIFAWKTKSLGGTVILGMLLYWAAGKFL